LILFINLAWPNIIVTSKAQLRDCYPLPPPSWKWNRLNIYIYIKTYCNC